MSPAAPGNSCKPTWLSHLQTNTAVATEPEQPPSKKLRLEGENNLGKSAVPSLSLLIRESSSRVTSDGRSEGGLVQPFTVGQEVIVTGLRNAVHYNGAPACVSHIRDTGSLEVVINQAGGEQKKLLVKAGNLTGADKFAKHC